MISLVFCLRRLPTLTGAQFLDYWLNHHGPLVVARAPLLRMRRYQQLHRLDLPALAPVSEVRSAPEPYDGVAQVYWDSLDDLMLSGADSAARKASRELLEDEKQFIDLRASPIFFTEAHVLVETAALTERFGRTEN